MKATHHVFPSKINSTVFQGLEVRDYIAIQAMVGILANSRILPGSSEREVAEMAYKQADAMIKRSEKNENTK